MGGTLARSTRVFDHEWVDGLIAVTSALGALTGRKTLVFFAEGLAHTVSSPSSSSRPASVRRSS